MYKRISSLLNEISTEPNLTFIHSNYGFLPSTITKLELQGVSLTDSITIIIFTTNKLDEVAGDIEITKFNQVLEKNEGFAIILKILRREFWRKFIDGWFTGISNGK